MPPFIFIEISKTGAPFVFGCTPTSDKIPSPGAFAAIGVFSAMKVVSQYLYNQETFKNKVILVQGIGNVGERLIYYLHKCGANVIICDTNSQRVQYYSKKLNIQSISPDEVYKTPCDIFSPCAIGGILNKKSIPLLRCKAIVGAANSQLANIEDERMLFEKRILYAPDYVVNVGEAMADLGVFDHGWTWEQAKNEVDSRIKRNLEKLINIAENDKVSLEKAAQKIVKQKLQLVSKF